MNIQDKQLCDDVLSAGKAVGMLSLFKVTREGSLLLALPLDRGVSLATLKLYQPQKWKGRFLRLALRMIVAVGWHRFLPKINFAIGDTGLFSGLDDGLDKKNFGFLLSNAHSSKRNLIGLYKDGEEFLVIKAGCGSSSDIVKSESETMKSFSRGIPGLPRSVSAFPIENGYAYVAEWIQGRCPRSKADEARIFVLLKKWLERGEMQNIEHLGCWAALKRGLSAEQYSPFMTLENTLVRSPVLHGDFAPWNIKILDNGEVRVLDWESAEERGVPGWDWLHYIIQQKKLVSEWSDKEVIDFCKNVLFSDLVQSYLGHAGLAGKEDLLLGSYLYFSGKVQSYPRSGLINTWLKSEIRG